ncbi:hypothetical protein LDR16_000015 [Salmonella enterica]|uniref:hypothetical protein n=1 Tax=Salmonella enterica TaxID=28901 RepID=UPI0003BDAA87|nr:hypothetical protein [Salmonella enterica subsp. enterica serovar Muenchen]EIE5966786.1 hypothetical protein [Salmonella enterica]ESG69815.1 hypothetical protein SEEM1594_10985 [Salmonella enterica subsp. enterica serovar Muenchen str. baa1594]EIN0888914.1 hypothetical protein [Salmonella enterica]ELH6530254.1 hypothetical protein [Salmonella enterica]
MNELRIKRLLIVSVILNAVLIFLFVQALSGNINPKKDVEKVASNVPIISPLCEFEKELDDNWKENFGKDPDNYREHNPAPCYWVNPITKKYFKFDKNIRIMKDKHKDDDSDDDYFIYNFAYSNTPYISLLDLPNFNGASMDEVKKAFLDSYKIRLVTKGNYIKRDGVEEWVGSGFSVNKDGSDGDFVIFAVAKKDNEFWVLYGYYHSRYSTYNDKRTMKLIDDLIETL